MSPGTGILSTGPASAGGPPPASGQWMLVLHQRAQLFVEHVRVDLRRGDIRMAQHQLYAAQVGAAFEQMAGEGMAQHVRRYARGIDAGGEGRLLQELRKALPRQVAAAAARGKEETRALLAQHRGADMKPRGDRRARRVAERHQPLLVALAA